MTISRGIIVSAVVAVGTVALVFYEQFLSSSVLPVAVSEQAGSPVSTSTVLPPLPLPSEHQHTEPLPGNSEAEFMHDSLSETDQAPAPLSAADVARQTEMEKLGYLIPPEYHGYELNYLKALAAQGDVNAKVHLAERYYFEIKADAHHPFHNKKFDYLKAATASLKDALVYGHAHSAAILAEIHLIEKQPVEAAAWSLLSEQAGDKMSRDWFKRTDLYLGLNAEQIKQAQALSQTYAEAVRQQAHQLEKTSLFELE